MNRISASVAKMTFMASPLRHERAIAERMLNVILIDSKIQSRPLALLLIVFFQAEKNLNNLADIYIAFSMGKPGVTGTSLTGRTCRSTI
jgi:hypothetical protein